MKIALLGDMGFYGKYSLDNEEIYEYFSDVALKLEEFDYVIGNLETPFTTSNKVKGSKSAYIKSEPENIKLLNFLNVNVVNLANNHIFDYGKQGLETTKKMLNEYKIDYFGVDKKELKINKKKSKFVLSGFCCYSTNGIGYNSNINDAGVNVLDPYEVESILLKNHEKGYLNIASFHIGEEHVNYPNYDHVKMARKFASKVPYVFYGHHPHVIQGIEEIGKSLIAYSLGNFCFDDVYTNKSKEPLVKQSEENKKSFILVLEIDGNKLINKEVIPLYAGKNKMTLYSDEINQEINHHSKKLNMEKSEYIDVRNNIINNYISNRKSKRNFEWYLKRLNLNSVRLIINAKKNASKYKELVKRYLKDEAVK